MTEVGNFRKIYFPYKVNYPKTQKVITESSKVNERYFSTKELQSKLEMAQRIHTESIRMLNYLSVKVSQILNKEGIQVSKDHDLKLKEILEISDSQFINKLQ